MLNKALSHFISQMLKPQLPAHSSQMTDAKALRSHSSDAKHPWVWGLRCPSVHVSDCRFWSSQNLAPSHQRDDIIFVTKFFHRENWLRALLKPSSLTSQMLKPSRSQMLKPQLLKLSELRSQSAAKALTPQIWKSQIPASKLAGLRSQMLMPSGLRSQMLKPSDRRTQMLKLSTLKSSDAKALRSKISDVKAFTSHLLKPSALRC